MFGACLHGKGIPPTNTLLACAVPSHKEIGAYLAWGGEGGLGTAGEGGRARQGAGTPHLAAALSFTADVWEMRGEDWGAWFMMRGGWMTAAEGPQAKWLAPASDKGCQ